MTVPERLPPVRRDPVVLALVALLVVAVVQVVTGSAPRAVAVAASPFVAAAVLARPLQRVSGASLLAAIGGAQVVLAAWTLAAFVRAWPAAADDPSGFYRVKVLVTTPAGEHNTVGGLLLVGVVVTAVLAVDDARWWPGVAVTSAGVVASLSRGAALVLLVAGLVALLVRVRRPVAVTVAAVGAAATAAVSGLAAWLGAAPPGVTEPSAGVLGASITGRVDLVVRGLATLSEAPAVGVGLGRFVTVAGDLPFPNLHAHNAVAHLGAEAGLVGAAVAIALPVTLAARALPAPGGPLRDAALLAGAALVAHAQVDVLAGVWSYEVLLVALLALAWRARSAPATPRLPGEGTSCD